MTHVPVHPSNRLPTDALLWRLADYEQPCDAPQCENGLQDVGTEVECPCVVCQGTGTVKPLRDALTIECERCVYEHEIFLDWHGDCKCHSCERRGRILKPPAEAYAGLTVAMFKTANLPTIQIMQSCVALWTSKGQVLGKRFDHDGTLEGKDEDSVGILDALALAVAEALGVKE